MINNQKLTPKELKQLQHLLDLIEIAVTIGLNNKICDKEATRRFKNERSKLNRIISVPPAGLMRYVTHQEVRAVAEMIKMGQKIIPIICDEELVTKNFVDNFAELVEVSRRFLV